MCPLDRARRVLLGRSMRKLESISRRIATCFTKFDVFFNGFLTVFESCECLVEKQSSAISRACRVLLGL